MSNQAEELLIEVVESTRGVYVEDGTPLARARKQVDEKYPHRAWSAKDIAAALVYQAMRQDDEERRQRTLDTLSDAARQLFYATAACTDAESFYSELMDAVEKELCK